jgi:hypothetical protein
MQYSFTLPADYDMAIIRQRIAANGHKMDGFPQLACKAFMHASRQAARQNAKENLYAPFYLWQGNEGMNRFLASSGFAALCADFGWPTIKSWSVWHAELQPDLAAATWASREILPIPAHSDLAALQAAESEAARQAIANGALAAVAAFEATGWSVLRFRLWPQYRESFDRAGLQVYEVGHVSLPSTAAVF